jgi:peptidyl-prolyl cis-trans isomerase-like 4
MVSFGDNFIGSQFFFTLGTDLTALDGIHCVIGEVVEGLEVLRKLNEAIVDEKHRPYKDIRITHTVVLDDPFPNPRGLKEPSRSPSPSAERLKNGRIGADEDIDDTEGKTETEIQEMLEEREAKARATILEIIGDIPDAEIAPPENVLFVCKLNPVTTDDDLQIIFSRFGKIKSCEVIRDKQSGDSLQYAFIEFDNQKSCEDAYFKMDNVLIDDRRIHVDFSQSVSKIKWRGKGNYTIYDDDDNDGSKRDTKRRDDRKREVRRSRSRERNRDRFRDRNNYSRRFDDRSQRRFDDRRVQSRNYDSQKRYRSPNRRYAPPSRRDRRSPPRRSRSRDRRRRSVSSSKSSSNERRRVKKSKHKKKSSKKQKKSSKRSSSSSSNSSSSSESDHKSKKHRR